MRTFQQTARMPPSNGIPESRKRKVKHKIKDMFDQIKSSRATVTVKAQLSQCLQVYRFFTQSCFKFLYPERSSTVRSERRTTTTSTQWSWDPVPSGNWRPKPCQSHDEVSQPFWGFRDKRWNYGRAMFIRPVAPQQTSPGAAHTGAAGWPPVHISQGLLGCTGWSNRDPPVIPWKLHPFLVQRCSPDSCCHS